jgi:1-acyl-sn-glycerol-3-phosphate acyltransferase
MARVIGMRVRPTGTPPHPPFLLVSNHLSYVDIALLATQLDCVFVAKRDIRDWPALGRVVAAMDTIFIDREHPRDVVRVNERIAEALATGDGVVLFAEGTSTRGDRVLPLQPSLLDVAARRQLPVWYASLTYRTPAGAVPADLAVCWWGDMLFFDHFFGLLKLPGFEARITFGPEPVRDTNRKQLAQRLHQSIAEQFIPVVSLTSEEP